MLIISQFYLYVIKIFENIEYLFYNNYGDYMLKILLGLLPGLLLFIYFFSIFKPKDKKKFIIILILVVLGSIGSYFCYRLEMHYGSFFKKVKDSNYLEILFYAFFGVAIFEEGYKWFVTLFASFFDKYKKKYNLFLYSIFTSISFATFENIVYFVIPYGINTAISRIFSAIPSHVLNAIWMGFFLEKYSNTKSKKKYFYLFLSLIVPTLVHALYNSFLYGGKYQAFFYYYYIPFLIITIIFYILIRRKVIEI